MKSYEMVVKVTVNAFSESAARESVMNRLRKMAEYSNPEIFGVRKVELVEIKEVKS